MYENMTYENIVERMLERVDKGMDKREGSIIYDATAAVAYHLAQMYFLLDHYADLILPDTSVDTYLDRFAEIFQVERKPATKAVKLGIFDRQVPLGSRFSAEGKPLIYVVTEQTGQENGNYICHLECETAGSVGNGFIGQLIPVDYLQGLNSAQLSTLVLEGTDKESDGALRERLLMKIRKPSTSGNAYDYYNWAMSIPGVGAVRIFPLAEGAGTVKVVIASKNKAAADAALVQKVAEYIEKVRPIGANVIVESAAEKEINISAKVRLNSSTSLGAAQAAFCDNMEDYLRNKAFDMTYISLAKAGTLLMNIEGVEDYSELKLNGEAENIIVKEEEVAVIGAVRLEMM